MALKLTPATEGNANALASWNEIQYRHADLTQELSPQRLEEIQELFFNTASIQELKAEFAKLQPFERTDEVLQHYNQFYKAHGQKKKIEA